MPKAKIFDNVCVRDVTRCSDVLISISGEDISATFPLSDHQGRQHRDMSQQQVEFKLWDIGVGSIFGSVDKLGLLDLIEKGESIALGVNSERVCSGFESLFGRHW